MQIRIANQFFPFKKSPKSECGLDLRIYVNSCDSQGLNVSECACVCMLVYLRASWVKLSKFYEDDLRVIALL